MIVCIVCPSMVANRCSASRAPEVKGFTKVAFFCTALYPGKTQLLRCDAFDCIIRETNISIGVKLPDFDLDANRAMVLLLQDDP
jgi:hypothetical protein